MDFAAFKLAHPELTQVMGWAFLLALVVLCFSLGRIERVHATYEELHHNHGSIWSWIIGGGIVVFIAWITWLIYRKDVWLILHQMLT